MDKEGYFVSVREIVVLRRWGRETNVGLSDQTGPDRTGPIKNFDLTFCSQENVQCFRFVHKERTNQYEF